MKQLVKKQNNKKYKKNRSSISLTMNGFSCRFDFFHTTYKQKSNQSNGRNHKIAMQWNDMDFVLKRDRLSSSWCSNTLHAQINGYVLRDDWFYRAGKRPCQDIPAQSMRTNDQTLTRRQTVSAICFISHKAATKGHAWYRKDTIRHPLYRTANIEQHGHSQLFHAISPKLKQSKEAMR